MVGSWDRQSLIYAMTIGDGYINPRGILTIEHGLQQKAYVQLKYLLLKNAGFLAPTSKIARSIKHNKKGNKYYVSWRFNTISAFKKERNEFYPEGKKVISTALLKGLTPEIFAFWYTDDGGQGGKTAFGMVLDVSAFSSIQKELLKKAIEEKFHIDVNYHDQKNVQGTLIATKFYFRRRNIENFINQIKPFFIPSLLYKLPHKGIYP